MSTVTHTGLLHDDGMSSLSAQKLLAKLAALSKSAGENYYQRIAIAEAILKDLAWVELIGDEYKACELLETKYFHDLSGSMTIWMLLQIYRKFPDRSVWEKANYNLAALYEKCRIPSTRAGNGSRLSAKVADLQKAEQEAKEFKFQAKQLQNKVAEKESELEQLRVTVERLKTENIRLKGRVEELEKIVKGKL